MSVFNENSTDSSAASPRQRGGNSFPNGNVDPHTNDNVPSTFIVTDPDSDIETDAVPDAPRPRGTPIPESPKPNNSINEEPLRPEEYPESNSSFSKSSTKSGKIPGGFPKNKIPRVGPTSVMYNVANCSGVHFGNNYVYGANLKQQKYFQENEEKVSPPKYEILMSSFKIVSDDHLDCVADNIGEKWKSLGRQLGLNDAAIHRLEQDNKDNHRERVYQLLLEWKQSIGGPNQAPLLSRLSAALWQIRERDALDGLVKLENDPRLES